MDLPPLEDPQAIQQRVLHQIGALDPELLALNTALREGKKKLYQRKPDDAGPSLDFAGKRILQSDLRHYLRLGEELHTMQAELAQELQTKGIPQEDIIQVLQQYRKHRIQLIHTAIVLPPALSAERDDTEELANSTRRGPWFWLRHLKLLLSLNGEDLLTWRAQVDNTSFPPYLEGLTYDTCPDAISQAQSAMHEQERAIAAINKMLSSQEAADTVLAQLDQLVDVPKPDIQEEDLQSLELGLPLLELLLDKGDELVQQIHKGIMMMRATQKLAELVGAELDPDADLATTLKVSVARKRSLMGSNPDHPELEMSSQQLTMMATVGEEDEHVAASTPAASSH